MGEPLGFERAATLKASGRTFVAYTYGKPLLIGFRPGAARLLLGGSRFFCDRLHTISHPYHREERSTLTLNRPDKQWLHRARSAVRLSASRMNGEPHPTKSRLLRWTPVPCAYFLAYVN